MSADHRVIWTIDVFDEVDETLLEEHELTGVTVEQLRKIFRQPDDNPMIDSFAISETQARALQPYLSSPLQASPGRTYFLECHSRPTAPSEPRH